MKYSRVDWIRAPQDFELDFNGAATTPDDAALLSQLLQAGLTYQEYELTQSNPDLAKILSGVSIAATAHA